MDAIRVRISLRFAIAGYWLLVTGYWLLISN